MPSSGLDEQGVGMAGGGGAVRERTPALECRMALVRSVRPEQPVGNLRAIVVAPGRTLCWRCAGNIARRQREQTGDLRLCTDRCTRGSLAWALPQ